VELVIHQVIPSMTWYIYANNNTVVPTGGCDVSSRNVIVNLPDYPGSMTPVPLTVSCLQSQKLSYYISGAVANTGNNIFSNTASSSSAQGVGIEISMQMGCFLLAVMYPLVLSEHLRLTGVKGKLCPDRGVSNSW
jgi:type 1 fimbria pilin